MAEVEIEKLAMIGCGSMGGGMAQLFAEHDYQVGLQDPSSEAMDKLVEAGKRNDKIGDKLKKFDDYKSLCEWLGTPKVFVWSLPHGTVGDTVMDGLMPYLHKGDIIIDAANEHWSNSERRQGKATPKGIRYVAMGVSGGYQAARRGPSCCPSSDDATLDLVLPHLQKIAAKDAEGRPCAQKIGTGSAGHYVKMIHNGIEHGMMAAISEAWAIMHKGLKLSEEEISEVFYQWNKEGEFKNTFLIRIGGDICATKDKSGQRVLETLEDKVVQDVVGEEGTGIWSNEEELAEHIPAPTLTDAHYLRIASADLEQRRKIKKNFGVEYPPQPLEVKNKSEFLELLRLATYAACLASYIEGLNVIYRADKEKKFNIDYNNVLQIWHAGCIIQSDYICRDIMEPIYKDWAEKDVINPLYETTIAEEFKKSFPALKKIVLKASEADHIVPTLSATLEYLKIQTSTDLPTSFLEAELDYFGNHRFDKKGDDPSGKAEMGKHSYEWKAA